MKARIITIGDEILIGQITDTNSGWIARRFNEAGVRVVGLRTVADNAGDISRALDDSLADADCVIITGGLGPTKDDITKTTLAAYFSCGMREDAGTIKMLEKMLASRGIDFNELNRSQAMIPDCCTPLPNHNGTAPGMWFEHDGKVVVSLPGVPFEMKALIADEVLPRLKNKFRLGSIVHRTLLTFGLAESVLATRITDWENALPVGLKLAYLPNPSGIRLRLSAYDLEQTEAEKLIEENFDKLATIIPQYILGFEELSARTDATQEASVQAEAARLLLSMGKTLSLAESCTGGYIAHLFTSMPGSSDYLRGGVVSYSYDMKATVLGVDRNYLEQNGAVNRTVAEQMATGVRALTGSDYAISTTGVAGPSQGSEREPVGTVWVAIAHPDGILSRKMTLGNLREQNIERASAAAINLLRLLLSGSPETRTAEGIL